MKNLSKLAGVQILSKKQLKEVNGAGGNGYLYCKKKHLSCYNVNGKDVSCTVCVGYDCHQPSGACIMH